MIRLLRFWYIILLLWCQQAFVLRIVISWYIRSRGKKGRIPLFEHWLLKKCSLGTVFVCPHLILLSTWAYAVSIRGTHHWSHVERWWMWFLSAPWAHNCLDFLSHLHRHTASTNSKGSITRYLAIEDELSLSILQGNATQVWLLGSILKHAASFNWAKFMLEYKPVALFLDVQYLRKRMAAYVDTCISWWHPTMVKLWRF